MTKYRIIYYIYLSLTALSYVVSCPIMSTLLPVLNRPRLSIESAPSLRQPIVAIYLGLYLNMRLNTKTKK
jgi:hypothetical protein